jgi:hypothetical protein
MALAVRTGGSVSIGLVAASASAARRDRIDIEREFERLTRTLEAAQVEYAVVGAFAVAIWGAPRATADIDLLVQPDDVESVLEAARSLGFSLEAFPMRFRDGVELRRITRIEGDEAVTLDLLLVDSNLRPAWESRLTVATEAGPVKVVSRDALLRMKAAAGRPQDVADIERLAEIDR